MQRLPTAGPGTPHDGKHVHSQRLTLVRKLATAAAVLDQIPGKSGENPAPDTITAFSWTISQKTPIRSTFPWSFERKRTIKIEGKVKSHTCETVDAP